MPKPVASVYKARAVALLSLAVLCVSPCESPAASSADFRCDQWNTETFFAAATADDVKDCLDAGKGLVPDGPEGNTPLHWAARVSNDPKVIDVLLSATVNRGLRAQRAIPPRRGSAGRKSPSYWRHRRRRQGIARRHFLLRTALETRNYDENTAVQLAARHNKNPAVLKALLEAGANLHTRDSDNYSALHLAAENNRNSDVVQVLLSEGADPMARDFAGFTASYVAARNENPDVLRILVNAEANVRNPVFDVTPLRDSNRFLYSRFSSVESPVRSQGAVDPSSGEDDEGRTFLEAQIAGDVPIWGHREVRHLGGNVGGNLNDGQFHQAQQIYASMMVRLRMTAGVSAPIPPPSFMPKVTYQRLGFRLNEESASTVIFSSAFGHHSNGQSGCPIEGQVRNDQNNCVLPPGSPPRPAINIATGSFSTHYIQSGLYYRRVNLQGDGFGLREIGYGGSVEYHLPCVKGALCELADRYGRTRLSISGGPTFYDVPGIDRLAVRLTLQRVLGCDVEFPIAGAVEVIPFFSSDFGLYFRMYSGPDYYNINFERKLWRAEMGATFDWGDIVRGLPSPF